MLLSVVVPFYHVEKYIGECLARCAQLPEELCEILLVDDCGTDGSARIAADFCAKHANMRVIRREKNGGLSAARNTGLEQAVGEYVYFLDSDDLPVPDALMQLVYRAKTFRLDVAKARFVFFDDETGRETPGPAIRQTAVMAGSALFAAQCRDALYEPMVWQCVYRRGFLEENDLAMAEGLLFEDELFQAPVLLKAKRAAAFELSILRYRQREGSIMGSFSKSSRWCYSYLEVCRRLSALAKTLDDGAAKAALLKRVGQMALSVAKNIPAYRLPPEIAKEAMDFARTHQKELAGYAMHSTDRLVAAQGLLLKLSLDAFIWAYTKN